MSGTWNLSGWRKPINRGPYALIGLLGFAIKHNLDRLLATVVFHRPWGVFNYWIPLDRAVRITSLSREDSRFLAAMLVLASLEGVLSLCRFRRTPLMG